MACIMEMKANFLAKRPKGAMLSFCPTSLPRAYTTADSSPNSLGR